MLYYVPWLVRGPRVRFPNDLYCTYTRSLIYGLPQSAPLFLLHLLQNTRCSRQHTDPVRTVSHTRCYLTLCAVSQSVLSHIRCCLTLCAVSHMDRSKAAVWNVPSGVALKSLKIIYSVSLTVPFDCQS